MNVIQIGSNRGNDDLTSLILPHKSEIQKLILVEPLSVHHDALRTCYEGYQYFIEKLAIIPNNDVEYMPFFYHIYDGPNYEISSIDKNHILKHNYGEDGILEELVPCLTLNQLCAKHNICDIEILFIDAEGFDDVIIQSIDFDALNIKKIIYEHLHIKNKEFIIEFLSEKNYDVQKEWGIHGWSSLAVKR